MKNDIVRKENVIDSLLVHNWNLLNYQCCRVIKDTQFNVQSDTNTDVTDNHSNNHGVDTITNEKNNQQTTSYKKNNKTATHRESDDINLIKQRSANSSMVKKNFFYHR